MLGGIFTFQILFTGRYIRYVFLTLLYSILHLAIIPFVTLLNVNVIYTLPFITVIWFSLGYPAFLRMHGNSTEIWKQFYKIGLSAFIINSAVSFALSIDKYFVNSFFDSLLANSYTFSWSLTAPVFYIGGIIEKFLYSGSFKNQSGFFKKGFGLSLIFITLYAVFLILLVFFFPDFLPASVDETLVRNISVLMISGYSIYCLFHFPVNAFLFKLTPAAVQKTISLYFIIVIIILTAFFSLVFRGVISLNYTELILSIWIYISLLLTVKVIILYNNRNKLTGLKPE